MLKLDLPGLDSFHRPAGTECGGYEVTGGSKSVGGGKFSLMVRVIPAWIEVAVYSACALLCFGSALSTSVKSEDYGLLLVGIAAVVGAYGARLIVDVRKEVYVPKWFKSGKSEELESSATWHDCPVIKFQAQEMAVDIYRIVQWIVMAPLIMFRVYQMAGETGNLFESKGIVTIVALCAVLSYSVIRVGLDDMAPSPSKNPDTCNGTSEMRNARIIGVISLFLGAVCYTLLMVDIFHACGKSTSKAKSGAEFVACVSIGYVVVIGITILARCPLGCKNSGDGGYSENLSLFKDVCYTGLGVTVIGFLAFGSAFDVLGEPFLNTTFFR